MQVNKENSSFELIYYDCGDLLPMEKNALSHKFLKFLTIETNKFLFKELGAEFRCNFENARMIYKTIYLRKIERTKIVDKVGRPNFKFWK